MQLSADSSTCLAKGLCRRQRATLVLQDLFGDQFQPYRRSSAGAAGHDRLVNGGTSSG